MSMTRTKGARADANLGSSDRPRRETSHCRLPAGCCGDRRRDAHRGHRACGRTRQIAAAHGARMIDYRWHDDFAPMRNHAIDHATGDWIFCIGADEQIRPYDRRIVENVLAELGFSACTVRFHPRTEFTAYPENRLFRRSAHPFSECASRGDPAGSARYHRRRPRTGRVLATDHRSSWLCGDQCGTGLGAAAVLGPSLWTPSW